VGDGRKRARDGGRAEFLSAKLITPLPPGFFVSDRNEDLKSFRFLSVLRIGNTRVSVGVLDGKSAVCEQSTPART